MWLFEMLSAPDAARVINLAWAALMLAQACGMNARAAAAAGVVLYLLSAAM
ncbi:MAG: hypothetical protein KF887_18125 [Paracoccaceae bacterium]|nr:MAG: hypothetical protein KF887_18125 [Paracoccaceae bacterium]